MLVHLNYLFFKKKMNIFTSCRRLAYLNPINWLPCFLTTNKKCYFFQNFSFGIFGLNYLFFMNDFNKNKTPTWCPSSSKSLRYKRVLFHDNPCPTRQLSKFLAVMRILKTYRKYIHESISTNNIYDICLRGSPLNFVVQRYSGYALN